MKSTLLKCIGDDDRDRDDDEDDRWKAMEVGGVRMRMRSRVKVECSTGQHAPGANGNRKFIFASPSSLHPP